MSPHDISRHMLQRAPYNLFVETFWLFPAAACVKLYAHAHLLNTHSRNAQSHDATVGLIRDVLAKKYNISKVYVDTVGPSAAYQAKLQAAFPQLSFTVESKADFKYPIVGAGACNKNSPSAHSVVGLKTNSVATPCVQHRSQPK